MKGWLLLLYFLLFFLFITCNSSTLPLSSCPHDQSFALTQFSNSFSIDCPFFNPWCTVSRAKTISRKEGTNCCLWDGVKCDTETRNVIALDLSCSCLVGPFPSNSTLFLLRHLRQLNLAGNDFRFSPMASQFGQLTNLTHLNIYGSLFQGNIPLEISHLSKLLSLNLSKNYELIFEGHVFESVVKNLTQLRHLLLELPDSIGNLRSLEILDLSHSNLRWSTPVSLGNLTQLEYLDLSHNNLSGPIPWSVFNLTQVQFLDFSKNKLEGSLPSQVSGLSQLSILLFDHNFLSGRVPTWLFSLPSLVKLRLNNNKLNGNFELDKLSERSKLEQLSLSDNALSSFTSASNANYSLPNLVSLELSSCSISEFPNFVRNLEGLTYLDLSNNRIHVLEEDMFLKLKSLKTLDLHNSPLSVSDNSNLSVVLPHLDTLWLSSCNITEFSNFLTMQESLTYLDISNNSIQGQITQKENNWKSYLQYLDLSNNFLTALKYYPWKNIRFLKLGSNLLEGPLLVPPISTTVFSISKNRLNGEIPASICNLVDSEFGVLLDLAHNNLSGAIPKCLGLRNIFILDLQMNRFHGNIPDFCVEENHRLQTLNLNNNDFDGSLPKSLANCVDLEFSGLMPTTYFTSFQGMMSLADVQMGYIGAEDTYYRVSVAVTMKGVDIELEKILTVFEAIDMSSNKFEGTIPETVGNLISLQVLNFSHNHLTGHIPSSLGNLVALESLDLSCNELVGEIPSELTGLNFLEVLNLSENQLVGPIPQGKQFNTFLNDSYAGNIGLCGFPVSKSCGRSEPPPAIFDEEEVDSAFGLDWKFVMMGYGCGMAFGFSAGYIMMTIRKPKWLVGMVQRVGNKILKRFKKYR
ncbi:hypothetical protein E1A91_D01G054200v1 [Gossypium mustelinum]|uniref:Leucine-rich repeat-containing N-terminal plant-type domain-containing protein n=1 Tax=Gossypium mustelinum TaxID=34275 RepID=A0A5D2W3H5_GOSMU|nr:hypothetical protein E1A91_D01G054200v1 [Gossypium mustelinum]